MKTFIKRYTGLAAVCAVGLISYDAAAAEVCWQASVVEVSAGQGSREHDAGILVKNNQTPRCSSRLQSMATRTDAECSIPWEKIA